jgi:uncharacterized protein (TIGR03437 family)
MKTLYRSAFVALIFLAPAFPQITTGPSVTGVITPSAYGGFHAAAVGSFVEIYGSNLAGTTRGWTTSDFNGPNAPTSLDGVSVTVGGTAAFISYVSPAQVNIQVPSGVPNGATRVVVSYKSQSSTAATLTINAQEPGFLAPASFNVNGKQYVAAIHSTTGAYVNGGNIPGIPTAPAAPGETLILYGTGFGPVQGGSDTGTLAPAQTTLSNKLTMTIGNSAATISYAGLAPALVGVYQFNVVVPGNVPNGDQAVLSTLNGTAETLQTLFLTVAAGAGTGIPGPPSNVSATAGDASASISFNTPNPPPPNDTYTATCTASTTSFSNTGSTSPIVVTGLTDGTTYSCVVTATNANGTSKPSTAVSVTPKSTTVIPDTFTLTSTAGTDGGTLPADYTCDGTGSTLPLQWFNAPAGTSEFAILLSTIPAPGQLKYDWVLYHIPATVTSLAKDSFLVGTVGLGDDGPGTVYDPPCSQGPGAKLYTITVYALGSPPTFTVPASQVTGELVATAISGITLGSATLNLSYSRDPSSAPGSNSNCLYIRSSLTAGKSGNTSIACDGTYAYISSIGMTTDQTMNGITSTNLQVPTPTDFLGANGWKIPLNPVINPAGPTSTVSGPIGVAVNGVPIFDPCEQLGCTAAKGDTKADGQLDTCNGHAGRADDYHYHAAPTCMMAAESPAYWNTHPVGWALDGFPIFGYNDADGSTAARDNICGGNTNIVPNAPAGYAYHVIDTFPYISSCLIGVPSPDLPNQASKYHPMRQAPVTPFDDTNMTLTTDPTDGYQVLQFTSANAFVTTETGSDAYHNAPGTYRIRYKEVTGSDLVTLLAQRQNANATACWNFEFTDGSGNATQPSVTYCKTNP